MLLQLNLENNTFFFIHYGFFTVFQLKFKMMLYNTISPLRDKYFSNYFLLKNKKYDYDISRQVRLFFLTF